MFPATFFLSTGRCGTQWLAAQLGRIYGDRLRVEHEPLIVWNEPRRMLASARGLPLQPSPQAVQHLAMVREELLQRSYVECGHPCWSSLPWLARELAGQIRIVHLVRHPAAMAASWVSRGAFIPPMMPYLPERVLISPFDPGSAFPEYQDRWTGMLPYEKCLLYWAEVNELGLELEAQFPGAWLRLRYEDLFRGDGARTLLSFLGLPEDKEFLQALPVREDRYRFHAESSCDPNLLKQHPRIIALAERLGYAI